jgi:hypothetical protein
MRRTEVAVSAVLLALAGVVAVNAIDLGIGWGVTGPASGFFPFWLALVLGVASVVNIVQALRAAGAERPFVSRAALSRVLKVGLTSLAFVLLIEFLGLYGAAALFLAGFMRWLGGHGRGACVAAGLGIPAGIYVLFEKWFLIPMPKGVLERWLSF